MKVLIVGGGIAGCAVGAFLEHSDVEYEIVEKSADWSHQGFLISIWDAGRDIVRKLGLADRFDALGSRMHAYTVKNGRGEVLRSFDFKPLYANFGGAITVLPRASLHQLIENVIPRSKIKMGMCVTKVSQDAEKVHVEFNDGSKNSYDFVVAADGVHSTIRDFLFGRHIERYQGWRVWYAWINKRFDVQGTITEYVESGQFAVVFSAGEKTMVCFSAPMGHDRRDELEGRVDRLKALFKDETYLIPQALDDVDPASVMPTDLAEIKLKSWSEGRVVLVGDAAHNFGPHIGIGGSMALEDAYVLAGELIRVSLGTPMKDAFEKYERERKRRVRIAQRISHRVRNGTLIASKMQRIIANVFLPFIPDSYILRDLNRLLEEEI